MTEQSTTTPLLVTASEARTLGAAAAILERISDRCMRIAPHMPVTGLLDQAKAQDLGRLGGIAAFASDALFDVANVATNYAAQGHALERYKAGEQAWREGHPWPQDHAQMEPPFHGHSVKV